MQNSINTDIYYSINFDIGQTVAVVREFFKEKSLI